MQKSDISEEAMIAAGWTKSGDPVFLFEKEIPNDNPINDSEDSQLRVVVHGMYNCWTFAILLPDGGLLNFVANSMKELQDFEDRITFYDPPF